MAMNWDDLRVFLAVARRGSLSAAARALKVTQPTVGRRLRTLEAGLSARLFDRLPEGFVLTAAGAELMQLAEAMEQAADSVERRRAAFADSVKGTVRLSIGEVMAQSCRRSSWSSPSPTSPPTCRAGRPICCCANACPTTRA
jgi:DNA-binding transcriptional LysR family regulator